MNKNEIKKTIIISTIFISLLTIITILSYLVSSACQGYEHKGTCYPTGSTLEINSIKYYIDIDNSLKEQKSDGEQCQNNFECLNNLCSKGICVDIYKEAKKTTDLTKQAEQKEIQTTFNVEASIATLKQAYLIGEDILLTDPPDLPDESQDNILKPNLNLEDEQQENQQNIESQLVENKTLPRKDHTSADSEIPRIKGYIVEFDEESTLQRKGRLDNSIEELNKKIEESNPIIGFFPNIIRKTQIENAEGDLESLPEYREEIKEEREKVLEDISDVIKEERIEQQAITGRAIDEENAEEIKPISEFNDIINGVVLDVTEEEADKIAEVSGVKEVYPNLKASTTLMDSVPLINADKVWQLQDNAGNILTGKGVKIGIIDTGAEYIHRDLGGPENFDYDFSPTGRKILEEGYNGGGDFNFYGKYRIYENKIAYLKTTPTSNSGNVFLYDLTTGKETQITNTNSEKYYLAFYKNKIAWVDDPPYYPTRDAYNKYIMIYDLLTGETIKIRNTMINEYGEFPVHSSIPISSYDQLLLSENKLIWTNYDHYYQYRSTQNYVSAVFMYEFSTGKITNLRELAPKDVGIIGPDFYFGNLYEDKLVLIRYKFYDWDAVGDVYLYDIPTAQTTRVTPNPTFEKTIPAWKWNPQLIGDKITWEANDGYGGWDIYLYDIPTAQTIKVTEGKYNKGFSFFNGNKIIWSAAKGASYDIFVYDLASKETKQITCDIKNQLYPKISGNKVIWEDLIEQTSSSGDTSSLHEANLEDIKQCNYIAQYFPNDKIKGGYDFSDEDEDPYQCLRGFCYHGTHVAATAAGNGRLKGVAPDADIYAFKVFPLSYSDVIIKAIERSYDLDQDNYIYGVDPEEDNPEDILDVISLSLGLDCNSYFGKYYNKYCGPNDIMSKAIDTAVDNGVIAVVAAGNSGSKGEYTINSPGTARKAITVGATYKQDYFPFVLAKCYPPGKMTICGVCNDEGRVACNGKQDEVAFFSSQGPVTWIDSLQNQHTIIKPNVVAPGAEICAAYTENQYACASGTSMATPIVSGAVALLKQAHTTWSKEEIQSALESNALDLGLDENIQGKGRINVFAATQKSNLPQSKLVNNGGLVEGELEVSLSKFEGDSLVSESIKIKKDLTLDPEEIFKLDKEWNPLKISSQGTGKHQVKVKFTNNQGKEASNSWEFFVCPLDLLSYWRLETNFFDSSPNDFTGQISGQISYQEGKNGQSISFPGNKESYVALSDRLLNNLPQFSISVWLKSSGSGDAIFSAANAETPNEFLIFDQNNLKVYVKGSEKSFGAKLNDNLWHHLAVTIDSTNGLLKVYVDGVLTGERAIEKVPLQVESIVLGQDQDSLLGGFETSQSFSGEIDEISLFKRVLTLKEIQQLHKTSYKHICESFTSVQI